jgi:uncharacterized protein
MAKIRRLVLDVVTPNLVDIAKFTQALADVETVDGVNTMVNEIDKNVITLKIIFEGSDLVIKDIDDVVSSYGGSIHSIDNVAAGKEIIEDVETPQD